MLESILKRKREAKGNGNLALEDGGVAQLGEHLPCTQGVRSSILLISTSNGDVASTLPLESLKDVQVCTTADLTECKRVTTIRWRQFATYLERKERNRTQ